MLLFNEIIEVSTNYLLALPINTENGENWLRTLYIICWVMMSNYLDR